MSTNVHITVTKWCTVGYGTGALWDSRNKSIHVLFDSVGEVLVICRHPWLQCDSSSGIMGPLFQ